MEQNLFWNISAALLLCLRLIDQNHLINDYVQTETWAVFCAADSRAAAVWCGARRRVDQVTPSCFHSLMHSRVYVRLREKAQVCSGRERFNIMEPNYTWPAIALYPLIESTALARESSHFHPVNKKSSVVKENMLATSLHLAWLHFQTISAVKKYHSCPPHFFFFNSALVYGSCPEPWLATAWSTCECLGGGNTARSN